MHSESMHDSMIILCDPISELRKHYFLKTFEELKINANRIHFVDENLVISIYYYSSRLNIIGSRVARFFHLF